MLAIFIQFFIVAAVVVVASKRLATNAEIIEENSTFNPIFMGLILSAATSLPELVSSLTSISLGNDVTAVSNVLGSNVFNVFALAVINIIFIKKRIFRRVAPETFKTAIIAIIMYSLAIVTFLVTMKTASHSALMTPFFNFTITTLLIAGIYIWSLFNSGESDEVVSTSSDVDLHKTKVMFIVLVLINVFASIILAHKAEAIIEMTGMSKSVAGAVLVGIATSLPEIITCYALVVKNKHEMAVTSILGSNTFNFLTFTLLDFTTQHSIYQNLDASTFLYFVCGLVLSVVMYFTGMVRGKLYILPSVLVIVIYLATIYFSAIIG